MMSRFYIVSFSVINYFSLVGVKCIRDWTLKIVMVLSKHTVYTVANNSGIRC